MRDPLDWPLILIGSGASLAAGLATGLGALPVLALRRISPRVEDSLLGFAAGVMLAASFFSLILPGLEAAEAQGAGRAAAFVVAGGIILGSLLLWATDRWVPHEHFISGRKGVDTARLTRIWLLIIAMTLHNFPEGLAVGVGFGGGDMDNGTNLAFGIGLQNAPEGLSVAVGLVGVGYSRARAALIALATGLVEPIGGFIGIAAVSVMETLLPWGLAFAAGAMIYVVSNEIIPETHRKGFETWATGGLMGGFVIMMTLDVTLS